MLLVASVRQFDRNPGCQAAIHATEKRACNSGISTHSLWLTRATRLIANHLDLPIFRSAPFPPPALPGFNSIMTLSDFRRSRAPAAEGTSVIADSL